MTLPRTFQGLGGLHRDPNRGPRWPVGRMVWLVGRRGRWLNPALVRRHRDQARRLSKRSPGRSWAAHPCLGPM